MSGKWTLKYGLAAVLVAIVVIAVVFVREPVAFHARSDFSDVFSSDVD